MALGCCLCGVLHRGTECTEAPRIGKEARDPLAYTTPY